MAKSGTSAPKQKTTLFSFFSKKPSPAAAAKSSSSSSGNNAKSVASSSHSSKTSASAGALPRAAGPSNNARKKPASSARQAKLLSRLCVGTKLRVLWPDDNEYYACVVHAHRALEGQPHRYELRYDDGDEETVDLARERFDILGGKTRSSEARGGGSNANDNDGNAAKKKRRIMEDSDEMMSSSEEEGDDSGSEYKMAAGESTEDESLDAEEEAEDGGEDDWLASDDDDRDEDEAPKKRRVVKRATAKLTVTRVDGGSSVGSRKVSPTPVKNNPGAKRKADANLSGFAAAAAPARKPASLSPAPHRPAPGASGPPMPSAKPEAAFVPAAEPGTVNPAGSHFHNHLAFLTANRKDLKGRPPSHPDFDPRTLRVDYQELARKSEKGKPPAGAQRQWWELKSQYADVVLLFKQGKFYEMFHQDADVAASVLGTNYMKGIEAHAGFPEAAYGTMSGKLVEAGYKVGRVEQTETKEELEVRKKRTPKGVKKPGVMCREVCGIVSKGTRTFCYLDDARMLESGAACTGPLVSIREVLAEGGDGMEEEGEDEEARGTRAVYEYGVTVVDAVTGVVTLGQFADDVLRSRLQTLLASFGPSEVLYEGGADGASKTLLPFLRSACPPNTVVEPVRSRECFPKSTAVDGAFRQSLERGGNAEIQPWDVDETVRELHRRGYYPKSSKKTDLAMGEGIGRWPEILRRCIEGGATIAISSFGAALFYLQRSLVDADILSMGLVRAYAPPNTSMETASDDSEASGNPSGQLKAMYDEESRTKEGLDLVEQPATVDFGTSSGDNCAAYAAEANCDHLALDGTTLSNLEILRMSSGSYQGSLLSKVDCTRSPHGSRLLRAWLLRPMFRKGDIDRRADAVEELAGGSAAVAMAEARDLLKKTGDIERLLSRVHSMGRGGQRGNREEGDVAAQFAAAHPDQRAVLYEHDKHTRRKVGDFSKLLNGLRAAADIPDLFQNAEVHSPLIAKIVRTTDAGGCFPVNLKEKLDWFFDNFDLKAAAKGQFEPARGVDDEYDRACDRIEDICRELVAYKEEMCSSGELTPRQTARSSWKYINTKEDSKDKYQIELPVSVDVPDEFFIKGKRGKGSKQVNKYRTPIVEELVQQMERYIGIKNEGKAMGMKLVFAKFDSMRSVWMGAVQATAMLDALGSLAQIAVQPGFSRPIIMDCPPSSKPGMKIIQGRHPCVDVTHSGGDFIPNDLVLGSKFESEDEFSEDNARNGDSNLLLLSGPNMGGKSTLLRQTCLITILAQIGSYVPAERCSLTPVDRIFTRLGASDRILCGQSTFFVELSETAAAVRGATRRSLVIMDELGRGTSTFDGTAIASATVKHLVEKNRCLTLFATHYHSLLENWKNEPTVKLGHMECIAEDDDDEDDAERKNNITFLYTLGEGPCPKSFGVNVARLAGLPDDVLQRAKRVSSQFESEMNEENHTQHYKIIPSTAEKSVVEISKLFSGNDVNGESMKKIWANLQ